MFPRAQAEHLPNRPLQPEPDQLKLIEKIRQKRFGPF
jgi:hypothetical protein